MFYLYELPLDTKIKDFKFLLTNNESSYYVNLSDLTEAMCGSMWWNSKHEAPNDRYKLITTFSDITELSKTHPELCI